MRNVTSIAAHFSQTYIFRFKFPFFKRDSILANKKFERALKMLFLVHFSASSAKSVGAK